MTKLEGCSDRRGEGGDRAREREERECEVRSEGRVTHKKIDWGSGVRDASYGKGIQ